MSMHDYETAAAVICRHPGLAYFTGVTQDLVRAAEAELGVQFPPTYRRFLIEFGAGTFGSDEVVGLFGDLTSP